MNTVTSHLLVVLASLAALLIGVASCTQQADSDQDTVRPNIVMIVADDLGWADVGYRGHALYETWGTDGCFR